MAIIPAFYTSSVTAIGVRTKTDIKWIGTGFFALRKVDDLNARPMLVTNKHVLKDLKSIVLRFRKKNSEAIETVDAPIVENDKVLYYVHPNDKIDIAVLPLNGQFITEKDFDFSAFNIDENALTSAELRNEGVDEGSLIHMLGFPMGLVNINSTLPICRLGCIARISDTQILESYNILIDIQNFPGNSGSPIVTRPEVVSISGTKALNKSVLVGIVHSYIPYMEELINNQTKQVVELRSENSGLALVHPVEFIREVVDLFQKPITLETNSKNDNTKKED